MDEMEKYRHHGEGREDGAPGPDTEGIERMRRESERMAAAGDRAVDGALSLDHHQFLRQSRQKGGE